jgi:hypothetical protein
MNNLCLYYARLKMINISSLLLNNKLHDPDYVYYRLSSGKGKRHLYYKSAEPRTEENSFLINES